jgi:hypothetical protein
MEASRIRKPLARLTGKEGTKSNFKNERRSLTQGGLIEEESDNPIVVQPQAQSALTICTIKRRNSAGKLSENRVSREKTRIVRRDLETLPKWTIL